MKDLLVKPRTLCLAGLVALVLAGVVAIMPTVAAQAFPQVLVYGQNSGTLKAIAVDSIGRQNAVILAAGDPCLDPNLVKTSAALNVTATAQVVPLSSGLLIYVCGWSATAGGTTPTLQWEYGTGSTCGTGTTVLTGTYLPTVGAWMSTGGAGTVVKAPASNALCMVVSGTTPSIQGVVSYVQQ